MLKSFLFLLILCTPFLSFSQEAKADEAYRPLVHFSPNSGWMSDPNGLVYYDGEYHLFYQHIPLKGLSGTHWGHAVSKDLLHWDSLSIALYPDSMGYIFSGSCVMDLKNTSGLGTTSNPPMIAIFTYHDHISGSKGNKNVESQAIAYSVDKGRTWTKYNKNPVLPNPGLHDFRDPKVSWDEKNNRWMMVLTAGATVQFYTSSNCLQWKLLSEFGKGYAPTVGPWECPDFFPLKVEGSNETKWVLIASFVDLTQTVQRLTTKTQYIIGDFDGTNFSTNQTDTLWMDYGRDNYAGVTFSNAPNDRKIFLGWMQSHQYAGQARNAFTHSWAGAATFPRELKLVKTIAGYRLNIQPVKEITALYKANKKLSSTKIDGNLNIASTLNFETAPVEINLNFDTIKLPAVYGIRLKNDKAEYVSFAYDKEKKQFIADRTNATAVKIHDQFPSITTAPFAPSGKTMQWKLLIDKSSIELFTGDKTIVFSNVFYPSKPFDVIELFTEKGTVQLLGGNIQSLKSITR